MRLTRRRFQAEFSVLSTSLPDRQHHLRKHSRVLLVRHLHETFEPPIPVALLLERIHSGQHGNQQVLIISSLVAGCASRKVEAFGPMTMLEHGARWAMLNRGRLGLPSTEYAERVCIQECLTVFLRYSHCCMRL